MYEAENNEVEEYSHTSQKYSFTKQPHKREKEGKKIYRRRATTKVMHSTFFNTNLSLIYSLSTLNST